MKSKRQKRLIIQTSLWSVLADLVVISLGYLLYTSAPFFNQVLSEKVIDFLPYLAACLFVCSTFFCLFEVICNCSPYVSTSRKAFVFLFQKMKVLITNKPMVGFFIDSKKNLKYDFFIVLIKLFFIPLMLQFALNNFLFLSDYFLSGNNNLSGNFLTVFNFTIYPFLIGVCFFVDTVFFLFGYLVYSNALGNTIRSVETTFLGWAVALLCYPPFNNITASFIPALYNDNPQTEHPLSTFLLRLIMIVLLFIYTTATVNLGWKCSNLTNRGIVSHGIYSLVRHPAYISKNLFWWFSLLPIIIIKPEAIFYMALWSFLYFLRAITEERHLGSDPEYIAYREKVKYRFIPKLY